MSVSVKMSAMSCFAADNEQFQSALLSFLPEMKFTEQVPRALSASISTKDKPLPILFELLCAIFQLPRFDVTDLQNNGLE